jgi:hypothetical protein
LGLRGQVFAMTAKQKLQPKIAKLSEGPSICRDLSALASLDRRSENILIKAAIITELELDDIEMNAIFGHGVNDLDDAAWRGHPRELSTPRCSSRRR